MYVGKGTKKEGENFCFCNVLRCIPLVVFQMESSPSFLLNDGELF